MPEQEFNGLNEADKIKKELSKLTSESKSDSDQEKQSAANSENTSWLKKSIDASFRPYENLTYEQAMQYISEGRAVKLPEWNGMWLPVKGKIIVFTKDSEILDTPDHETYGKRNDWTTVIPPGDIPVRLVKTIRVRIDRIITYIKTYLPGNRETASAYTAGQLGFMWLGLFLGDLGAANPYPQSTDATSPVIEKHADKDQGIGNYLTELLNLNDETARVKYLRQEVQNVINLIEATGFNFPTQKNAWAVSIDKVIECKLWLGQQLNNIRIASEGGESK